ncbi:hypothetical protein PVA45_01040 [Entomospira entomophila]|uniref:Uncharacterized protein n=1 Tax=Entomospira entomophila TaxID=2719988 RepID=A0A968G952_9SPIO|nr:hypothetical protein [Entomospira entomophilus]NIZ40105.1 hypothetical protein [Entomospira entomophilus]WDI35665.1 hypothetical protein PVA45_01040 [Entomospira entomophilus]
MTTHKQSEMTSEFSIFHHYFNLRFFLFLKEEMHFILILLVFSQLSYAVNILGQMAEGGASSIIADASAGFLPLVWILTASAIFAKERKPSRNLLTLSTPINAYHRFTIAVLITLIIVPLATFLITRLLYLANISLASILVPLNENTASNAYTTLTTKSLILAMFPFPITALSNLWFLPITFFFMAATFLKKHVFLKVILLTYVVMMGLFLTVGIVAITQFEWNPAKFMAIFDFSIHLFRNPLLYELAAFIIGTLFLTVSYLRIRKFTTI